MTYTIDIAGMKRDLPICPVTPDLSIGAFVMFGDVEITEHAAKELLARAPEFDYIAAPEAKAIPWPMRCPASPGCSISWPGRAPRRI